MERWVACATLDEVVDDTGFILGLVGTRLALGVGDWVSDEGWDVWRGGRKELTMQTLTCSGMRSGTGACGGLGIRDEDVRDGRGRGEDVGKRHGE